VVKVRGKSSRVTIFKVTNALAKKCNFTNYGELSMLAEETDDVVKRELEL
jgi:hypothetical protein